MRQTVVIVGASVVAILVTGTVYLAMSGGGEPVSAPDLSAAGSAPEQMLALDVTQSEVEPSTGQLDGPSCPEVDR